MPERKPSRTYDRREVGLLAGLRIRKKLMLLHTLFSVSLAALLVLALQPMLSRIVADAEYAAACTALERLRSTGAVAEALRSDGPARVDIAVGTVDTLSLPKDPVSVRAIADLPPGGFARLPAESGRTRAVARLDDARLAVSSVVIPDSRSAIARLNGLVLLVLLGAYLLIALALEVFVLPRAVYRPIRVLLSADAATRAGDEQHEVIPPERIPLDELGEIMRSHNETVTALRSNERQLAAALGEIERVAADLKTKNDLLEAARRNLADTDRLASLGMMSAGIAHEINTPLTVVSGLTQRLSEGATLSEPEAGLLRRVIARLERLAESLLDYARVRPAIASRTALEPLVHEAFTLVSLDRNADQGRLDAELVPGLAVNGDPDRLLQVLVNLARNGLDAMGPNGRLLVTGDRIRLEGADWVRLRVVDDGPGIDPAVLPTLFEPFVSTRLDAKGTGLGLAVAQAIVSEQGGTLVARNREDASGAMFEIILPEQHTPAEPKDAALEHARPDDAGPADTETPEPPPDTLPA